MTLCTNEILAQVLKVGLSSILSCILVILILRGFCREGTLINRLVLPPVRDNFYNKCTAWKNEFVFLSLKDNKAYIGTLWKYPENPQLRHDSQTISIIPLVSGYRCADKHIIWNTHYPKYKNEADVFNMETLIPRSEIITFRKFHDQTFQYFYKQQIESNVPNN